MTTHKPILWSIAGADCSGGAGIAADIKTAHQLGIELCHLITANTVQNSEKLIAVNAVSIDVLAAQYSALIDDKPPQVIKVGLLVNAAQVNWLIGILTEIKSKSPTVQVVLDPVGQASVGGSFISYTRLHFLYLLPLIDVITPNAQEALFLAEIEEESTPKSAEQLAQAINALGCNTVVIKGGHSLESASNDHCHDYCLHTLTDNDSSKMSAAESIAYELTSPRINTTFSHGGGCSFATAIASFIGQGHLIRDAFTLTKAFMNQGMNANKDNTSHYGAFEVTGYPINGELFPTVADDINRKYQRLGAFSSLNLKGEKLGLYPVIDSLYWLERLLPLNINIIQLRVKDKQGDELEQIIKQAVALTKDTNTRLFINDYWQLAMKHGAYGVHIGQEDLLEADLTVIQQSGIRLGISTHGCYEFLLAQQLKPSYLAIGAIFPTKTKNMTGQIQGVETLEHIMGLSTDIPVVAIGGINLERAPGVLATDVDSIAVVTAITEAESPEGAVESFYQLIGR